MKSIYFKSNKGLRLFFAIQIGILLLLLLALCFKFTTFSTICFIIIILLCIYTYYALFIICKDLSQQADLEAQNTVLQQHNKMQQEHLNALKENEKIWSIVKKHVIDNYQHNPSDSKNRREYINRLIKENSTLYNIEYCDNKIVDAILYNKVLLAKSKDIQPMIQVLIPEKLPISPITLMTVYSNLLDNAIEATEKLPEKERFLNIESAVKAKFLIIKVENSKLPNESIDLNKHVSTKKDSENHGIGLQILQRACKENHGQLSVEDLGERVIVTATLQFTENNREDVSYG